MAVLEKVIQKCRNALGAKIPIVYIVSDSLELVQQVVNSDLLVLRAFQAKNEFRVDGWLPIGSFPGENRTPGNVLAGTLREKEYKTWDYPHIVYCKAENVEQKTLEQYIADHENKDLTNYQILQNSVVLLYSSGISVSPMVRMYTEFITVDYPDAEEIYDQIMTESQRFRLDIPGQDEAEADAMRRGINEHCRRYSTELVGFTEEEIRMTLRQILTRQMESPWEHPLSDEDSVVKLIRNRKKSKMQGSILELKDASGAAVGGMKELTEYLDRQKHRLIQADLMRRERGISPPKGVLLCGIPGCGKSEAAKATAKTFGLPLIQMDMGKLMGSHVGESEKNMNDALALAEAMAPCVLWVDELEKGFSAASASGDADGGTFKRMFATLLGWMQDNKAPVFLFATANDIGGLPKEFFRSGRFDEKFAVYLPTARECAQIFLSHMNRIQEEVEKNTNQYGRELRVFQKECLRVDQMKQFVDEHFRTGSRARIAIGSDILQLINTALALPWIRDQYPLSFPNWNEALEEAMELCSFYGDGAENLDSIAISYCRLLRKGMKSTTANPLIRTKDYQPLSLQELMQKDSENQRPAIAHSRENELSGYDRLVYVLLRERINIVSPYVERMEADAMLRR